MQKKKPEKKNEKNRTILQIKRNVDYGNKKVEHDYKFAELEDDGILIQAFKESFVNFLQDPHGENLKAAILDAVFEALVTNCDIDNIHELVDNAAIQYGVVKPVPDETPTKPQKPLMN